MGRVRRGVTNREFRQCVVCRVGVVSVGVMWVGCNGNMCMQVREYME